MNRQGRWLVDGQTIAADGTITGREPSASIAGYWLGGVAAAYQSWSSLLENYLQGVRELELSGREATLEAKTYVDQAMPYKPLCVAQAGRSALLEAERSSEEHAAVKYIKDHSERANYWVTGEL